MIGRYLVKSPPVAAAMNAGTPVIALETSVFMNLPYPDSLDALQECERLIFARNCVPCTLAVIDGKIHAGLSPAETEQLCGCGKACSRVDLASALAGGKTAAMKPSAVLAVAKLLDIDTVIVPGLTDSLEDLDALCATQRLVFCPPVSPESLLLYQSRGIPVSELEESALADAFLIQRDLMVTESTLSAGGTHISDLVNRAGAAALSLKTRSGFQKSVSSAES